MYKKRGHLLYVTPLVSLPLDYEKLTITEKLKPYQLLV